MGPARAVGLNYSEKSNIYGGQDGKDRVESLIGR